jgi:hypothetical protein
LFLWRANEPGLKEIELSAPIHLPFDQLEFGDLSFHLAIGPRLRNSGVHCALIIGDPIRERGNEAPLGFINPRFELHLGLLSDHRVEVANESLGIGQLPPNRFLDWLDQVLPPNISPDAGEGASGLRARLADSLDELDGVLLAAIEEIARADEVDMTGAEAEAKLIELWQRTFTAVAAAPRKNGWSRRLYGAAAR